jgi:hypothetical protein
MTNFSDDPLSAPLKRFFVNVRQDDVVVVDRKGILASDVSDAIAEALVCSKMRRVPRSRNARARTKAFEILDDAGELVAIVPIT